ARERLPEAVCELLDQKHLRVAAARAPDAQARREDLRVVDDDELTGQLVRELREDTVPHGAGGPFEDEQPGRVAGLAWGLRDQLRRELVVELRRPHPAPVDG